MVLKLNLRSKKRLLVTNEDSGQVEEHLIPHGKHVLVQPGDFVQKGQLITEGAKDPQKFSKFWPISCARVFDRRNSKGLPLARSYD